MTVEICQSIIFLLFRMYSAAARSRDSTSGHGLGPDESLLVKGRAQQEHGGNVDKPLAGDVDD